MYLEVFEYEEMFDLRFIKINDTKKHDSGCGQLYTNMRAASDVVKS